MELTQNREVPVPTGPSLWISRVGVILFVMGLGLTLPKGASHTISYGAAHGFLCAAGWAVTIGWLLHRFDVQLRPFFMRCTRINVHRALSDVFYPALLGMGLIFLVLVGLSITIVVVLGFCQ